MEPSDAIPRSQTTAKPPPQIKRKHKQDDLPAASNRLAPPSLESMTREQVSRYALITSIDQGGFEDVKFFAFSRRTRKGKVCTPRAVFGNSVCIRKSAPHFDSVLTVQGWEESAIADMNADFPAGWATSSDDYDYASDSDIEDVEDNIEAAEQPTLNAAQVGPGLKANDSSISDGDDTEGLHPSPPSESKTGLQADGNGVDGPSPHALHGRSGRVVFLKDMAYRTWRAFVFYSYFGTVSFARLRSEGKPPDLDADLNQPQCSPKSMYRLADKYNIKELKTRAAKDIRSKLTTSNIYMQLFSTFTSLHPEIQEMEVDYLRAKLNKPDVMNELAIWINYLAEGRLPAGATKAIFSLISKLTRTPV